MPNTRDLLTIGRLCAFSTSYYLILVLGPNARVHPWGTPVAVPERERLDALRPVNREGPHR